MNDELEVVVLELDVENRRLALSHKHLEENPWDTFETVFTMWSVHKCSVLSVNDKGAALELPYGIEGFCTAKNLIKEDGSKVEAGETLDFKVLEFSKEDKRIILSHKAVYSKVEEQPKPAAKKAAPKAKAIDKINKESEKSTLGDLEALSALKDKMQGASQEVKEAPKKKTAKAAKKDEAAEEKDEA